MVWGVKKGVKIFIFAEESFIKWLYFHSVPAVHSPQLSSPVFNKCMLEATIKYE
jgi:hypothetical protein